MKKLLTILLILTCSFVYGQKQITIILGSGTGGSSNALANFYLKDSSLSNDRTVDLDGNFLKFEDANAEVLFDSPNYTLSLEVINDVGKESEVTVGGDGTNPRVDMYVNNGALEAEVNLYLGGAAPELALTTGDGVNNSAIRIQPESVTYTADVQLFNAIDSIVHTADVSIFHGNVGINQNPNDNTRLLDVFNTTAGLTLLQISLDGKNSSFTAYDPTGSGAPSALSLSSDLGGTNVNATLSAADNNTSNSASIGLDGYNGTAQLQAVNGITISAGSGAAGLTFNGAVNFRNTPNSFTGTLGSSVFTLECDSGPYNINLPDATTVPGRVYVIKVIDAAGTITVVPNGAQTIDGAANYPLASQYKYVMIQANSVGNWSIIGNN